MRSFAAPDDIQSFQEVLAGLFDPHLDEADAHPSAARRKGSRFIQCQEAQPKKQQPIDYVIGKRSKGQ